MDLHDWVASHWKAEETSTAALMADSYARLLAEGGPGACEAPHLSRRDPPLARDPTRCARRPPSRPRLHGSCGLARRGFRRPEILVAKLLEGAGEGVALAVVGDTADVEDRSGLEDAAHRVGDEGRSGDLHVEVAKEGLLPRLADPGALRAAAGEPVAKPQRGHGGGVPPPAERVDGAQPHGGRG